VFDFIMPFPDKFPAGAHVLDIHKPNMIYIYIYICCKTIDNARCAPRVFDTRNVVESFNRGGWIGTSNGESLNGRHSNLCAKVNF